MAVVRMSELWAVLYQGIVLVLFKHEPTVAELFSLARSLA